MHYAIVIVITNMKYYRNFIYTFLLVSIYYKLYSLLCGCQKASNKAPSPAYQREFFACCFGLFACAYFSLSVHMNSTPSVSVNMLQNTSPNMNLEDVIQF